MRQVLIQFQRSDLMFSGCQISAASHIKKAPQERGQKCVNSWQARVEDVMHKCSQIAGSILQESNKYNLSMNLYCALQHWTLVLYFRCLQILL